MTSKNYFQREKRRTTPNASRLHRHDLPAAVQSAIGHVPVDPAAVLRHDGEPAALAGPRGEGGDGSHVDRS